MNATALLLDLMNLGPMGLADVVLTSDGHYLGRHAGEAGYNVHIGAPKSAPGPGQDRSRELWQSWNLEQRAAVMVRATAPPDGFPIPLDQFGIDVDAHQEPKPAEPDQAAENRANGRTPAGWPGLETLEAVHRALDGVEWSADTTDAIATILAGAGYTFRDPDELEPAKSVPFLGNDDDPEADQAERGEE